ncbi:hypothetical protein CHGG_09388 [Chaetomium globosum CBS 148.51]|uniref:MARVEL domain-containing protein n=1 Tax=Chaetomium globosum (strain ATCC 6205 / CBS 148.51 / DSM 1962 / NBRC 6347 / NRRL 1970) TaxID=306901 RepID=Q2GRL6_CHAGB|nr:uncharacterized protein CHGG_09388 [Chaetomium globosum CBS 148.51]EAQ85374.1 hypothetical protein CHGG_09388 [Chaetomium globosum CBS 148.51]
MAAATMPQQAYAEPTAAVHDEKEQYIQQTPLWVVIVRALQIVFSFVTVIMAGVLIHGKALGANGFAVACVVFTWIIVSYTLITEKVASARGAYNIWAVLSLDLTMVIFWLASLGANAELRASFNVPVNVESCFNDGSAINSNHCTVSKRAAVAGPVGLALISAIAGVSALEWLLFLATLIFHGHTFRLWHQEHKTPSTDNATVEMKAQGTPMLAPQHQPPTTTTTTTTAAAHPQYTDQQQYQSTMYPQQPDTAYAQQTAYPPQQHQHQHTPAGAYPPQQQQQPYGAYPDPAQYQQQQMYSPHGTPVQGQPYYPPQ